MDRISRFFRAASPLLLSVAVVGGSFLSFVSFTRAAAVVWDGGGVDTNWNTCENWTGDLCPGAGDVATFNGTSVKNATINVSISVSGIAINAGYSGIITQASGSTISLATFSQTAGTFVGGNSAITLTGAFSMSGGSFTSTSGTLSVGGDWTHVGGGALGANSGTVEFVGAASIYDTDGSPGDPFCNVIMNKNDGVALLISANDALQAFCTLTLQNGMVNSADSGARMEVQGTSVVVLSTFDGGTGFLAFAGNGPVTFDLTGATDKFNGMLAVNKVDAGTVTLLSDLVMDEAGQTLQLNDGVLILAGHSFLLTGTGGSLVDYSGDGGVIQMTGNETTVTLPVNSDFVSLFEYVGDGDGSAETFTIKDMGSLDGYNVRINDTHGTKDTFVLGAATAINGTLTVSSGAFQQGTQTLTVGAITTDGGTFTGGSVAIDVNGALLISSGSFTSTSNTMTVSGGLTLSGGTFVANAGTVTLDGASQTLSGAFTFNNLNKTVSSAATLTFPASTTTTISGTLNLQGASGQLLSIRSGSAGVQATLAATTVTTPNYLDVMDNLKTGAEITCLTATQGCVNSGNNTGWLFIQRSGSSDLPVTPITVTVIGPNGGETYAAGERADLTWSATGAVNYANLYYSVDSGASWKTIILNEFSADTYPWTVPNDPTVTAMVKVEVTDMVTSVTSDVSDAVFTLTGTTTEPYVPTDPVISGLIAGLPTGISVHSLVRLPDDGDPETDVDTAVYYIGADGRRHAFPNEDVFYTWYCDFSSVQTIDEASLSSIVLGKNVTFRPGVYPVKLLSLPAVYAVDQLGTLRWIRTETVAEELYGDSWNNVSLKGVSDALFEDYVFGADVLEAEDFDLSAAQMNVTYPSDTWDIPDYIPTPSQGLICATAE